MSATQHLLCKHPELGPAAQAAEAAKRKPVKRKHVLDSDDDDEDEDESEDDDDDDDDDWA